MSRVSANRKEFASKGDFRKLGLDGRAVNALAGHGIFGIEDLAQYTHSWEFASLPGVGAQTCKALSALFEESCPTLRGKFADFALGFHRGA